MKLKEFSTKSPITSFERANCLSNEMNFKTFYDKYHAAVWDFLNDHYDRNNVHIGAGGKFESSNPARIFAMPADIVDPEMLGDGKTDPRKCITFADVFEL